MLCKRRVSANNFTLPNAQGALKVNPFSKRLQMQQTNSMKRVVSGPEFFHMFNLQNPSAQPLFANPLLSVKRQTSN